MVSPAQRQGGVPQPRDLKNQDGSDFFSTIHVESVEQESYPDVYKSESTSIELDITVPPWSGSEELEITFRPVPLTQDGKEHHWRICR